MVYEARHAKWSSYGLAGVLCALSLIGFFVAGVIPSESTRVGGAYPVVGGFLIAAFLLPAALFLRRALSDRVEVRMDSRGIFAPRFSDVVVPWSEIASYRVVNVRAQLVSQRYIRFVLDDPERFAPAGGFRATLRRMRNAITDGSFGINPTFYHPGMDALLATLHHYRPDLRG